MINSHNKEGFLFNPIFLYLFLAAIFLLRLPSFYFLPVHNTLFTTQVLARILIALVFFAKILESFLKGKEIFSDQRAKIVITLIIILFFIQSLSIFSAMNYQSFLFRYFKDVVPGVFTFLTFYLFRGQYKKIILALLLPTFFNIFYQAFMIVDRDLFVKFAGSLIYDRHLSFVLYNLDKGRTLVDTYDEASLPLLLLINITKIPFSSYLLFILVAFFAFISNWRIRILMLFFGLISSFLVMKKLSSRGFITLVFLILFTSYSVNLISVNTVGFSFLDRLTFQSKLEDVAPISSRIEQIRLAFEMGLASPFGVGLGNYFDNLPDKSTVISSSYSNELYNKDVQEGTEGWVHNIFGSFIAESGYLSLIVFLTILTMFVKSDLNILKNGDNYKKALVLSFWTIFIHSLLNPNVGGAYLVFFWGTRGLLLDKT